MYKLNHIHLCSEISVHSSNGSLFKFSTWNSKLCMSIFVGKDKSFWKGHPAFHNYVFFVNFFWKNGSTKFLIYIVGCAMNDVIVSIQFYLDMFDTQVVYLWMKHTLVSLHRGVWIRASVSFTDAKCSICVVIPIAVLRMGTSRGKFYKLVISKMSNS